MTFLAPGLLWGLLALIPLAAIYLLKVRPRRKPTNAYFLWKKILEEKTASALFRRFRDLFSLVLMLLATALLVLALARPKIDIDDGRDLVIVIDHSPSMAAGEGDGSTLQLARERASAIIHSLDGSRRAAIAQLADQLRFVSHLSDSPKDLLEAIEGIQLSALGTSPSAIDQINRLARRDDARVIMLTDGHAGFDRLSEEVEVISLAGHTDNAGIVAADLAWLPGRPGVASLFFRVASSFEKKISAELIFRNHETDAILRILPLTLEPGLNEAQNIEIEGVTAGAWTAILELSDELEEDNHVTLGLNDPQRIQVQVVSQEPYFFQRSIEAFERVGSVLRQVASNGEVVVSDGLGAEGDKLILFQPAGESPWWQSVGGEVEVFAPEVIAPEHPLLRHLDVETLPFAGARQITAPPDSVVLVETQEKVPLIYKTSGEGGRQAVVFNLNPSMEDFVLSPWFPVLIYESSRHLVGEQDQLRSVYPLGSRVSFPRTDEALAEWKTPNGVSVEAREGVILQPGLHFVDSNQRERLFGASLLQSAESLLDRSGPETSAKPLASGRLFAWWLLLIALLIVCAESILYHRRKLG